jgi:hypothetical protein
MEKNARTDALFRMAFQLTMAHRVFQVAIGSSAAPRLLEAAALKIYRIQ